ncbi:MAG TPA: hypothetical protein VFX70_14340 [Mycobacteriales bacterium]|nr:hypothetical protein [Mycobacteriales bacterium]
MPELPGWLRSLAGDRPPREALRGVPADDRLLAWATLEGGGIVLATRCGLWLPDRTERPLGWHQIVRATWRDGVLTLVEAVEAVRPEQTVRPEETGLTGRGARVMVESPPARYRLTEPRRVPFTVRQRVEHSIGYRAHHHLDPSGGVYVVGRRVAGRDGLTWYLIFDGGADPEDPLARIRADELLAEARDATGL